MAISKEAIKEVFGQTMVFPDAYHRIELLERNGNAVSVKLVSYTDNNVEHELDVTFFQYELSESEENSLEKAYEYIKSTPGFEGAVNC